MEHYFPSCNFRAQFPETTKAVMKYMKEQGVVVENCCRVCKDHPEAGDSILSVCTTCRLILAENRPDCEVETAYDHIRRDASFAYPDLSGRHFILQDCGKADESFKASVRRLLDAMHVDYEVSPEDHFCGRFMMSPIIERNMTIAPKTFHEIEKKITVCSKEEQDREIQRVADSFHGQEVIVYCNSCHRSLKGAGANAVHLLELLFNTRG